MAETPKTQNQTLQPIKISLETGVWTNTLVHEVLYSLKQRKFIKGRPHKGLEWGIDYLIFPGYYAIMRVHGYRDNRGIDFTISKVRVKEDGSIEYIETMMKIDALTLKDFLALADDPSCPEALRLFIKSIPLYYHSVGSVPDPSITFPDDELERIREYLEKKLKEHAEE